MSLEDRLVDLSAKHGLSTIHRTRTDSAANGRRYGGVALIYKSRTASLKTFEIYNPEDHEVLVATGTAKGLRGTIAVVTTYVRPNYMTSRTESALNYLSNVIVEVKRKFRDCWIVVGGDFNQWGLGTVLEDHPDLSLVLTEPTRGSKTIDLFATNFNRQITEAYTLHPFKKKGEKKIYFVIKCLNGTKMEFCPQIKTISVILPTISTLFFIISATGF